VGGPVASQHELNRQPDPSLSVDPIAESRRQWIAHGWGAPDAMAAVTSIVRVQQLLLSMVESTLRPLNLSLARYEALVLLYFSPDGSLPLGKISERLQVHPATVTNIIDRLETQGLVHRSRPVSDRRTVVAALRPSALPLVEEATVRLVRDVFSQIPCSQAELHGIFEIFSRLREQAGDFLPESRRMANEQQPSP
jgi:DNA-binding MarR family transcriptional regulator